MLTCCHKFLNMCIPKSIICKLYSKIFIIIKVWQGKVSPEPFTIKSQAGFRFGLSCVDNLFVLNEVIQGRLQEGKKTFSFFLDIKKAYDTVWRDGLWYRMWEMGIQGKLWRVIRNIYNVNQSCVYLDGIKSEYFGITQGAAQGCTLSPMLFLIFVDGLMEEIESKVSSLPSLQLNGLLFADDFVGLSDSKEGLQDMINVVHAYSKKWRFEANVNKSAVVVFRNEIYIIMIYI